MTRFRGEVTDELAQRIATWQGLGVRIRLDCQCTLCRDVRGEVPLSGDQLRERREAKPRNTQGRAGNAAAKQALARRAGGSE